MALGITADAHFDKRHAALSPDDKLFVFTDGISEAFDAQEREYGEDRLQTILHRHRDLTGAELIARVAADVNTHCGPTRQHDDMTMLVMAMGDGASLELAP